MIWIIFLWVGFFFATRCFLFYLLFLEFPPIVVVAILSVLFADAVNFVVKFMQIET